MHIRKRPAVAGDNSSKSLFGMSTQRTNRPAIKISALERKVLSCLDLQREFSRSYPTHLRLSKPQVQVHLQRTQQPNLPADHRRYAERIASMSAPPRRTTKLDRQSRPYVEGLFPAPAGNAAQYEFD